MKSQIKALRQMSPWRLGALVVLLLLVGVLSSVGVWAFGTSIGMHSWFTAEQVWRNHRQRLVDCVRTSLQTGEVSKLDACQRHQEFFVHHHHLVKAVDAEKWGRARREVLQIGLSPSEADAAVDLFETGEFIPQVASATLVWRNGVDQISRLEALIDRFRRQRREGPLSTTQRLTFLRQLDHLERELDDSEQRLVALLQDGAPKGRYLGVGSIALALLLLIAGGAYMGRLARLTERERARIEQRLLRRERNYQALVEHLHEPMCAVDTSSGRVHEANSAFWQMLGEREQWDGQLYVHDFLSDPPDEIEAYLRAMADGGLHEKTWRTAAGEERIMQMTSCLVPGTRDQAYLLARDITELREYEASMMEADRMIAVGMLAAGVGHEINNPLTYVASGIDFAHLQLKEVLDRQPPADADEALERWQEFDKRLLEVVDALEDAREGTRRVRDIVRDLRTFSRREEVESIEQVDVEPIMELALDMASHELKHKATVVRDYGDDDTVLASESRLAQVFLNLVINAAQAIEEGTIAENEVRVSTRRDADEVVVQVTDTGKGIAEEDRASVFEPFSTTKPVGEGTGLGLAISRNIVESLGGTIRFESTPGEQTTFTVRLPAADAFAGDAFADDAFAGDASPDKAGLEEA